MSRPFAGPDTENGKIRIVGARISCEPQHQVIYSRIVRHCLYGRRFEPLIHCETEPRLDHPREEMMKAKTKTRKSHKRTTKRKSATRGRSNNNKKNGNSP